MKFFTTVVMLLFSFHCFGYTNFIGHGYTSCLNCHYNPFGGGPLNDYGRVISATAVSSKALYPKTWDEEKLAYTSGFLLRKPKQSWLRTQLNYRGFQLVRNPNSSKSEDKLWLNMQADGRVVLKFGENDKLIAVANYGYAPLPQNVPEGTNSTEWRSREHYIGYRFLPNFGVYLGLMDKVFGIKVIEHIAYSRTSPQVAQNDQVHSLTGHYLSHSWELGIQAIAGNLSQDPDLRMQGISSMVEKTIFGTHRIGSSFKSTSNDYLKLMSYSVHTRLNLKEGSALLAELGQTTKTAKNADEPLSERFGLIQTYLRPTRGFYVLTNIEYFNKDINQDNYSVRWGPGLQYFPLQRLELRMDIYNTRSFSPDSSSRDSWMYLLQTHIWL